MQNMLPIKTPTIREMPAIFQTSWVSYESWIRIWKSLVNGGELIVIIIDNVILHVQNSLMSWFYPGFHSPWSCFFFQCYPFPPVGPSLVKWVSRRQQGPTPQQASTYPPAVARSTQPLKRCPARAKLQEMTSYVLSCSCAKRDGAASTFRKVQRQGPWRSSSTAVRRTWEAGTLLDCPPPAPSTYSPRVCSWMDRTPRGSMAHAEDLSQDFFRDDTSEHLLQMTDQGLINVPTLWHASRF